MESSFIILFSNICVKGLFPPKLSVAALGLHCCSSCGRQGVLFTAVQGLLIAGASLVA